MAFEGDPLAFNGGNIIRDHHTNLKVGVLGAGIAGLYTALILDSLDIEYEILEASDRTGGRICTYRFPGGGKFDYYDAGAMRFPLPPKDNKGRYKNGVMKRLAELIEYGPLNDDRDRLKDKLLPYYFQVREGSKPGCYYFNGTHEPPFGARQMGVDPDYIRVGVEAIIRDVTVPFARMLRQDMETGERKGLEMLMANDSYTLRSYMGTKYLPSAHLGLPPQHLPDSVINWCGLFRAGNDLPLSKVVLTRGFFHAETDDASVQWKCLEGGYEMLPKKIEEYLNGKGSFVKFEKRVTAISRSHVVVEPPTSRPDSNFAVIQEELQDDWIYLVVDQNEIDSACPRKRNKVSSVAVTVNGDEMHNYSHVISALPLCILRTIDLGGAGLDVMQKNALHSVEYGSMIKIGMLFKSNWWTTKLGIVGGQSFTDLPIHTIVYPSYGVDSRTPSKVLIVAYTSGEKPGDAHQLGALITSRHRDALKELVLCNLAEVHRGLHPDVTYDYLKEEFVDMHVKDWIREEYAMGGTATYIPGALRDFYPSLTHPAAGGRLHFAGEAVSYRQGWVVGALQSAWRAVYGYLEVTGQDEKVKKFKTLWGGDPDWAGKPSPAETA